jgi:predicted CopG family antitoxin
MKKSRVVSISLTDDEYEMYQQMAKVEGKSFSDFVRKKLKQAVTEELKEANLLNQLVRLLKELPSELDIRLKEAGRCIGWEEWQQIAKLMVYQIKLMELLAEYVIVVDAKKKEFLARKEALRNELEIEV